MSNMEEDIEYCKIISCWLPWKKKDKKVAEIIYGEARDEFEKKSSNKYPFSLNTVGKTWAPPQSKLKKPWI